MCTLYLDKTVKQKVFSLLAVALLVIITGVNSVVAAETVRIGIFPDAYLAMIAAERGLFQKAGVDVVLLDYPTGKRALEGMFAGEVDFATTIEPPAVFASFERSDFSIVASISTTSDEFRIVSRKDRGIQSPADLKGRHIAVQNLTGFHYFLHLFLLKNGLQEEDVQISFLPTEKQPQALAAGTVDAIVVREPLISEAKRLLDNRATIFAEPGIYQNMKCLVAAKTFMEKNSSTVRKVLIALVRAEEFAKKDKDESQRIIANRLKLSTAEVMSLWPHTLLRVSLDQQLLLTLEDAARWMIKNRLTTKDRIPNYLKFIHVDGLQAIKPEAVTMIR